MGGLSSVMTIIQNMLTAYRDAIQFVHDQTIRYINKGYTPDELVEVVKLPPHLANHPWLGDFYGGVPCWRAFLLDRWTSLGRLERIRPWPDPRRRGALEA